jgi:hypothetical protein
MTLMQSVKDDIVSDPLNDVERQLYREVSNDIYWQVYEENKNIIYDIFNDIWDELDGLS